MSLYKMRISAKVICFNQEGKILLNKGKTLYQDKEFWCVPGGGVEEGESIYQAAEREVLEESGYRVKVDKIVFIQDYEHSNNERNVEIFLVGKIDESVPQATEIDHEPRFFSEEQFKHIKYLPEGANPFELAKLDGASYKTYL